jgi:hypothetical protein
MAFHHPAEVKGAFLVFGVDAVFELVRHQLAGADAALVANASGSWQLGN